MINAGHALPRLFIDEVQFKAAAPRQRALGLLGFVTCRVNGCLRLDGLTARRTAAGRLAISFPARRDSRGVDHPLVRPVDDRTRREIEEQILGAMGLEETPG